MFPLAAASWAVFTVLARRWRINPIDATLAVPLLAFLLYVPFYWLFAPKQLALLPWTTLLATGFFQGVVAFVVSMWAFSRVAATFGPVKTSMMTALAPALAAVVAVPMLGEPLSLLVVLGLLAVTAGMIVGVGGPAATPVMEAR
jgi:drug/metabolite transporter (DMT)-like permease